MHQFLIPLAIIALGVSLAYWIGYPWPWSAALDTPTFLDAASKTLPESSPHHWRPTPREPDEPRYWFLRFTVHPHQKTYEQWAYGESAVSAMNAISVAIGGGFVVLDGDPISRLMPPRLDVKVFGEPTSAAVARIEHQRRYPPINARLALSEIQRASLPPCRNHSSADTPRELQRVQYIVPQAWLTKPGIVEQLKRMQDSRIADVLVMRHINGPARPLSDFV